MLSTASLSHMRTMLPKISSRPIPDKWPNRTKTGISSQIRTKWHDWAIWQARAGYYFQAALSSNDQRRCKSLFGSKSLYQVATKNCTFVISAGQWSSHTLLSADFWQCVSELHFPADNNRMCGRFRMTGSSAARGPFPVMVKRHMPLYVHYTKKSTSSQQMQFFFFRFHMGGGRKLFYLFWRMSGPRGRAKNVL